MPHKHLTIAITGHRKLDHTQIAAITPVLKTAIENIIYYYQSNYKILPAVICSTALAEGADSLFAKIATENNNCSLKILLPFSKEEYIKDFFSDAAKHDFETLINHAKVTGIEITGEFNSNNKPELYLKNGQRLVDENEFIIAVWNEQGAAGEGGTGDIVKYALAAGKNILVINPTEKEPIIKPNYLPDFISLANKEPRPINTANSFVENYYNLYDDIALRSQSKYKKIWQWGFRIGWLGGLFLALEIIIHNHTAKFTLTCLEVVAIGCIYLLIRKERKFQLHKTYLNSRYIAEKLRVNTLMQQCGYYPVNMPVKAIHSGLKKPDSIFPLDAVNNIILLTSYSNNTLQYKKERVTQFAEKQVAYYKKRIDTLTKKNNYNHAIKKICLGFLLFVIGSHISIEIANHFIENKIENFSPIALGLTVFLTATLLRFEGVKHLNDWERLIVLSEYMEKFFEDIVTRAKLANTDQVLNELTKEMYENMYLEVQDWEMFMNDKNEISLA